MRPRRRCSPLFRRDAALIRENHLRKIRPGSCGVLMADPACLAFAEATRRPAAGATHLQLATDD